MGSTKTKDYMVMTSTKVTCSIMQSSARDQGLVAGVGRRVGKSCKSGISHGKGVVHAAINCVCNVCGSAHSCGGVVNSSLLSIVFIRELVDSLRRDGTDTPMPPYIGKAFTRTNVD